MVSVKFLFAINKSLFTLMSVIKNIKGVRNKQGFFLYFFISFMYVQVYVFIICT